MSVKMSKRVSVTPDYISFDHHFLKPCNGERKTALWPPVNCFIVVVQRLIQEHCLAVNGHQMESQVPVGL